MSIPAVNGVPAWDMKSVFLFRSRTKEICGPTQEMISFGRTALVARQRICLPHHVLEMSIPRTAPTHPVFLRVKVWRTGKGILDHEAPLDM